MSIITKYDTPSESKIHKDIPNIEKIWNIVQLLLVQNRELNEKIDNIKYRESSKISPIKWINCNIFPKIAFIQWLENLQIIESDMHQIFNHGFIKGNLIILQRLLLIEEERDEPPLYAFTGRRIIYKFNGENWEILTNVEFTNLMHKINKNLMTFYKIWFDKNMEKINDPNSSDIYLRYIYNIMGGKLEKKVSFNKIFNLLYKSIKKKLKDLC